MKSQKNNKSIPLSVRNLLKPEICGTVYLNTYSTLETVLGKALQETENHNKLTSVLK
jgi:hypothetical protein